MNNSITFAQFDRLLEELGFKIEVIPKSHVRYYHEPSDTLLLVRLHKPNELVPWHELASARHHLDVNRVIEKADFEAKLHAVAA